MGEGREGRKEGRDFSTFLTNLLIKYLTRRALRITEKNESDAATFPPRHSCGKGYCIICSYSVCMCCTIKKAQKRKRKSIPS